MQAERATPPMEERTCNADDNPVTQGLLPMSMGADPAALSPYLTYGCVDWFVYENYPTPARRRAFVQ